MDEKKQYTIQRMDPLGQGVSLDHEKVTFIPNTLPGETVEATVFDEKGKKVQFARLNQVITPAKERQESPCPHFLECQGCSFLHTDYPTEVKNKQAAYGFLFKKFIDPEQIKFHEAPERLNYRNRIQLHYEIKGRKEKLGFINPKGIHPVPECLLPHPNIQSMLKEFYKDGSWVNQVPSDAPQGHLELYKKGEEVQLIFNSPYSDGGFSQVNQPMAKAARDLIQEKIKNFGPKETLLIDLFGGKGFLTKGLNNPTAVIDFGAKPDWKNTKEKFYIDQNLFKKKALQKVKTTMSSFLSRNNDRILLVDPPRSGMKNIAEFVEGLKPQYIAYLSCNPHTQVRDLQSLSELGNWKVEEAHFYDFFPATHHLESLVFLKEN